MTQLSPHLMAAGANPFIELDRAKTNRLARGEILYDFGIGEPREPTPLFIRSALSASIPVVSSYPRATGLPNLRNAISAWIQQRFAVAIDPNIGIIPTLGSKEIIFSLASLVLAPAAGRDVVITTSPGYPIPERGARFFGAEVIRCPLTPERDYLPNLDAIDQSTWDRTCLLWLNYPNNPTGAVAPASFLREVADRCRRDGVLLASDEAYSELWFGEGPPPSVLQTGSLEGVIALNTLSKRSCMVGYRSGFAAGDPAVIDALKRLRSSQGVTPPEFVQQASAVAWGDEEHVDTFRSRFAQKRAILVEALGRCHLPIDASEAGLYLWLRSPGSHDGASWAAELLERTGILVTPGAFFGPEGEDHVRMALVPAVEECVQAAEALTSLLD